MITHLSHATIFVNNQDDALKFYTAKLGFSVKSDVRMGDFRWLTVSPPHQKEVELVLMEPKAGPMLDAESARKIQELLKAGRLGAGVFGTDDCAKTYQELKAKGVEFLQPPTERPYGIEALLKDNSGNWFSLTQAK